MNFKPGSRLEIVSPQSVRFMPEPDGGAGEAPRHAYW